MSDQAQPQVVVENPAPAEPTSPTRVTADDVAEAIAAVRETPLPDVETLIEFVRSGSPETGRGRIEVAEAQAAVDEEERASGQRKSLGGAGSLALLERKCDEQARLYETTSEELRKQTEEINADRRLSAEGKRLEIKAATRGGEKERLKQDAELSATFTRIHDAYEQQQLEALRRVPPSADAPSLVERHAMVQTTLLALAGAPPKEFAEAVAAILIGGTPAAEELLQAAALRLRNDPLRFRQIKVVLAQAARERLHNWICESPERLRAAVRLTRARELRDRFNRQRDFLAKHPGDEQFLRHNLAIGTDADPESRS